MPEVDVFLGLGSNLGQRLQTIQKAMEHLRHVPDVEFLQNSRFYKTSPVSDVDQSDYVNAVCHIRTHLHPKQLFEETQKIEKLLGKKKKEKNQPRVIDIDILLYGDQKHLDEDLIIPHPHWKNRLFVLIPLSDLIDEIFIPLGDKSFPFRIKEYIKSFPNPHNEKVEVIAHA